MTARIIEYPGGSTQEIVAPRVELFWDWRTNGGRVVFHMLRVLSSDGDTLAEVEHGRLEHGFDALLGRTWQVPTGELDNEGNPVRVAVPTALLMATIKEAFDVLYNERVSPPAVEAPAGQGE